VEQDRHASMPAWAGRATMVVRRMFRGPGVLRTCRTGTGPARCAARGRPREIPGCGTWVALDPARRPAECEGVLSFAPEAHSAGPRLFRTTRRSRRTWTTWPRFARRTTAAWTVSTLPAWVTGRPNWTGAAFPHRLDALPPLRRQRPPVMVSPAKPPEEAVAAEHSFPFTPPRTHMA